MTGPIVQPRQAALDALWTWLEPVPGFVTKSRKLRHWSKVPTAHQPALFMVKSGEFTTQERGRPPRRSIRARLFIYASTEGSPDVSPDMVTDPLADAIEAAIAVRPGFRTQTLGGVVEHCWIAGEGTTEAGLIGSQAWAILPVELFVIVPPFPL